MVETGRYTAGVLLSQRSCKLYDRGEVEDQIHLIICPDFYQYRLQLFNHCNTLSCTFFQRSTTCASKSHSILSFYDNFSANIYTKMHKQARPLAVLALRRVTQWTTQAIHHHLADCSWVTLPGYSADLVCTDIGLSYTCMHI